MRTAVSAGVPSAPYLMTGYDQKSFRLSHDSNLPVTITIQVDITGTGTWQDWQQIEIEPRSELEDRFPSGFNAYWLRVVASRDCHATAQFTYE